MDQKLRISRPDDISINALIYLTGKKGNFIFRNAGQISSIAGYEVENVHLEKNKTFKRHYINWCNIFK